VSVSSKTLNTSSTVASSTRRVSTRRVWRSRFISYSRRLASVIFFLCLWQVLSDNKVNFIFNFYFIPAPTAVFSAFVDFIASSPWIHFQSSITRVIGGFFVGSVLGILLGLLVGSSHLIEELLATPLELLRPIPAVAWIPLAILMFPDAEIGMFYITFVGAFYPILVSTQKSVESSLSDLLMIRVGQCLGASYLQLFRDIIIPSALPGISAGLVIGMGNAWFCLVTAEILAGKYGIGYKTWESYVISEYPPIVMGMILIGLLGALSSQLILYTTNKMMPWRQISKDSL
jgi:NitT/TauT family transport system permease protein